MARRHGAVTSVGWVLEKAARGSGLAPDPLGWLVLHGPAGVLAALALSAWEADWGPPTSSHRAARGDRWRTSSAR